MFLLQKVQYTADLIVSTLKQHSKNKEGLILQHLNAKQYISLGEVKTPNKGSIFQIILRVIRHDKRRLSFVRLSFWSALQ